MNDQGQEHLHAGQILLAQARLREAIGEDGGEQLGRRGLGEFRDAMDWLEDTPEFEVAHWRLDEAGQWVRESYGCWLTYEDGRYQQRCPVALAHNRIGMSVGMKNVVRVCSVCGLEPRLCRHVRGKTYLAARLLVGELCNLCQREQCDHVDGEMGDAQCWHLIVRFDADHIAFVRRPAMPTARITSIDMSNSELAKELGPRWSPGMPVSCDKCLRPCHGVIDPPGVVGADDPT